jgi:hypothetical protein
MSLKLGEVVELFRTSVFDGCPATLSEQESLRGVELIQYMGTSVIETRWKEILAPRTPHLNAQTLNI